MDEFWKSFANSLIMAFAPIIAALIAGWLAVTIKRIWAGIKADRPELAYTLETVARIAVQAAEQAGAAGYIEDKKQYAIEFIQNYLDAQGWGAIDVSVIEAAIEAAVYNEFNKDEILGARAARHLAEKAQAAE